ncbi:DUF3466 family protein [Vibrio sp. 10N.222.52.C3]|uniref:DUF3466 family protein n=1 Tax=Vibrio sp. 10N.222.52.C3 TaxID=3229631 RepID=UPI003552B76B
MKAMVKKSVVVSSTLLVASYSNAALYRVVLEESPVETESVYGVAVEPELGTTDCFSTSCGDTDYAFAGEAQNAEPGFSFKEEVPFGIDNTFYYLDYDDIYSYCTSELGYATCEAWSSLLWYGDDDAGIGGLKNERDAYYGLSYQTNSTAFYDSSSLSEIPDVGSNPPDVSSYSYSFVDGTEEKVITKVDENGFVLGNTSSGYYSYNNQYIHLYRQRGYYDTGTEFTVLQPEADTSITISDADGEANIISQMGRTMAFDSFSYGGESYVVGSASVATFYYSDGYKDYDSPYTSDSDAEDLDNCIDEDIEPALYPECQNFAFANRAFVWNITDANGPNDDGNRFAVSDWETSSTYYSYNDDEASAQASVRAATISSRGTYSSYPVLVGYNTELDDSDNFLMQAAVFRPSSTSNFSVSENAWTTTFIANATVEVSDSYIHSNSVATDINENMMVIGYAKRDGDYPSDRVSDNRMFVADANDTTPTATFFASLGEDIFFDSAEGKASEINSYNEIVGYVDAETHAEVDGHERRHRGFIFPYNDTGTDADRRARYNDQAWWLDDLTNGGDDSDANNHFRILDATDINDAGVISGTAIQCFASESSSSSMAYDSTAHFAYCNDGVGDERVVAVKLIPISGATSEDIAERSDDSAEDVERSGAGTGLLVLISLMSVLSVRLKKSRSVIA